MRNKELHTGALAFVDLATGKWIAGFYRVIQKIVKQLGYTLEDVLGKEEAAHAANLISSAAQDVTKDVRERIGKLKSKITVLNSTELESRRKEHEPKFETRSSAGGALFKRQCPACESAGSLIAAPIGATPALLKKGGIVTQRIFWPTKFECRVCGLTLTGYEELQVAGLGDQIVDEDTHDPIEFFGVDVAEYITDEMIRESVRGDYGND